VTDFDPQPPRTAGGLATVAAVVGVGLAGIGGTVAGGLAALGLPLLVLGAFGGRREAVSVGGLLVVGGAILGGVFGAPVPTVVAASAAAFVAWDVAEHGVGLGEQVGSDAHTRNAVVVHAAGSVLVAAVTTFVAVLVFTVGPSGRPLTALVLLLLGAVVIAVALTE